MRMLFKICNATYWMSLTIWIAALLSAGVAAGGVFATLPKLGITIEKYQAALGGDTHEYGLLAGGMIMEPVFTITDFVQAGAAIFVVLTLILQLTVFRMRLSRLSNILRTLCLISALGLISWHMITVAPRMNHNLRAYWHAAEVNDQAAMREHRSAFDADHISANRMFSFRLALLSIAVLASAVAFTPPSDKRSELETPALLRKS